jgi:hypothetical protein
MGFQLIDGTGQGYAQKVDAINRAHIVAFTRCDCADNAIRLGKAFEFATGAFIAPTTDTEHAILYLKNTSATEALIIHTIRTCGSAIQQWIAYKNDTGGTIISDGNAGVEQNLNFRSTNEAVADVFAASAAGKTRSGGSWLTQWINDVGHSNLDFEGALVLGTGDSLTLTAENVASATTVACARILAYYEVLS